MIKHIIWDFDGTLFNTYPAISKKFKLTLEHFDIEEEESFILKNLHVSLWHTYMIFVEKYGLTIEALRKEFTKNDEAMNPSDLVPFKGVKELLLSHGKDNYIFTHRGNSTYKYLSHWGFTDYFTEIITREDGYPRKPEPDALLYLIDKYHLEKSQTIYIGDRDIDVQCAKNAAISSCYFDSHNIPSKTKADYSITSFENFII